MYLIEYSFTTDTQVTSEYLWLAKTVWVKQIPPTKHPPKFSAKRMERDLVDKITLDLWKRL